MRPIKIGKSYEVSFSPDGSSLLSLGRDVNLWTIADRKKRWRAHPFSHPASGTFSPDGTLIAIKNTAGQIVILNAETGEVEIDFENKLDGEGSNIRFSHSGEELIDGSWNGIITVRSRRSGEIVFQREFKNEMVTQVHISEVDDVLLTQHSPKAIKGHELECYFLQWRWPLVNYEPERLPFALKKIVTSALDYSGSRIAIFHGTPPSELSVIDLASASILWSTPIRLGGSGNTLAWSRNGEFVAGVQDKRIVVYRAKDGLLLSSRDLEYPCHVDFSPNNELIAYGSWQSGYVEKFQADLRNHAQE